MKKILFCLVLIAALAFGAMQVAAGHATQKPPVAQKAAGYLHVANATEYANVHAYKTFCNSSNSQCPTFPRGTGWYQRINNNEVRVEIYVRKLDTGRCYRVFDVRGYDGNMQISTTGSAPYWSCQ